MTKRRQGMVKKKDYSKKLDALSAREGIVLVNEKIAAYRGDKGELRIYSAV